MKYIIPSSKIVFTDFMILLVSALMGLNSVMSFSKEHKEIPLPPVNLPLNSGVKEVGTTATSKAYITIRTENNNKIFYYNNKEVTLWQLTEHIQKSLVPAVVLRGDQKTIFEWAEFCHLAAQLMEAGVKEISYATTTKKGANPS